MNLHSKNQNIKHIQISSIKTTGETPRSFLYTCTAPSEGLIASVRENGIITPVVVSTDMQLVCGVKRLQAARILHLETIPALITATPVQAFLQGLWENLSFRNFSTLELGEIILHLKETAHLGEDTIISSYLPALGLPPTGRLLQTYVKTGAFPPRIKKIITDGNLKKSHILLLTRFENADAEALAGLFADLAPSSNEARIITGLLTDLTAKRRCTLSETIKTGGIQAVLKGSLAPKHKTAKLRTHLREALLPGLTQREEEIRELAGKPSLHESIQVHLPPDLSRQHIDISMRVTNPSDFTQAVSSLNSETAQTCIAQILNLLRGDRTGP